MNGWLDPTVVGRFDRDATVEIRTSLTLEDTPPGIPGEMYPTKEDKELILAEYPITAGDVLNIEIHELRDRLVPFQTQTQVSSTGFVNLPIVGRVKAADLTVPEFEKALSDALREKDILLAPQVTVNAQFLQRGTYSIFGIGVSASDNSPLRAGTFPIRRPDLRVLEAINQVGGLNEFVSDVYIFRYADVHPTASLEPKNGFEEQKGVPFGAAPRTQDGESAVPSSSSSVERQERSAVAELREAARPRDIGRVHGSESVQRIDVRPELRAGEVGDRPEIEEGESVRQPETAEPLGPDPTHPFLWVNDEWVSNPSYRRPARDSGAVTGAAPIETSAPAVNWARISGEANYRVIRISAESLRIGDPDANIYIRAGDILRVVSGEIGVYYVMGQVNRVGAYNFNAEPITLKAAIAAAGGLSGLAWPDRCTVYRRQGYREQLIQVDLDRVFAGKVPDFLIRRSDIINVGTHPFAPFLQRIRAWTLPNPTNNVGYSFTYSRNYADIDSFSVRANPHNEPDRFPALFP